MIYKIKGTDTHYNNLVPLTEHDIMSREPESLCVGDLNRIVRILREECYLIRLQLQKAKDDLHAATFHEDMGR